MNPERAVDLWSTIYERGYSADRKDDTTRAVLERCLERLEAPVSLLDVGCGYCELLDVYRRFCGDVTLVDAVDLSSRFAGLETVTFRQASVLELRPSLDRLFDVVVASKLLHNIPRDFHRQVVSDLALSVREDGLALISVASSRDPSRSDGDLPLPEGRAGEYLTGVRQGREAYRFYFEDHQVESLVERWFETVSLSELEVVSGVPGHGDRIYWMFVGRRRGSRRDGATKR